MAEPDQIDFIVADLAEYTRLEVIELGLNVNANLRSSPPLGTPRDTGWAAANWVPSVGAPKIIDASVKGEPSPAQVAARAEIAQKGTNEVLSWKPEAGAIFSTNNVPYIIPLNNGHSQQSPSGFVQIAMERAIQQTDTAASRKGARNRRADAYRARTGKPSR